MHKYNLPDDVKRPKFKKVLKIAGIIALVIILAISAIITYFPDVLVSWDDVLTVVDIRYQKSYDDRMIFLDVGQADCTVIMSNGEVALVDTGDKGDLGRNVVSNLIQLGVTDIKYIIGTHYHNDHIGGISAITENFSVENIILNEGYSLGDTDAKSVFDLFEITEQRGINQINAHSGLLLNVGDFTLEFLTAYNFSDDENENSAVIRAECGGVTALLMADAGSYAQSVYEMLALDPEFDTTCDILKVAHHGSGDSTTERFLQLTVPLTAIISCSEDNSYGHPAESVLEMLNNSGTKIYRTDKMGNITIKFDGNGWYGVATQKK